MDCERLDTLAMDLVDPDGGDGIDPRVMREAEEHLASCVRCAAVIDRLRMGMRAGAELGLEDPSSLLEARILAATSAVPRDVSLPRRLVRAISTAGSWAMRPQVAMAAVLVVMVGTSIVLFRGQSDKAARNAKVTEEGTPVATLEPPTPADPGGAPAIIGGGEKRADKEAPAKEPPKELKEGAKAEAKPTDTPKLDENDGDKAEAESTITTKNKPKSLADEAQNKEQAPAADDGLASAGGKTGKVNTTTPSSPPPPPAAAPAPLGGLGGDNKDYDGKGELAKKGGGGNAPAGAAAGPAATTAPNTTNTTNTASYDDAMTAYKASKWAAAAKGFDAAAASGQKVSSSLLYAARSHRAAGSCAQALPRYQKLVNGYPTSGEAPHGAIEGGQCAKALSDVATARTLFEKAKTYPATQKQAEAELAALDKPPQAAPPAKAKAAKPPSASVDSSY